MPQVQQLYEGKKEQENRREVFRMPNIPKMQHDEKDTNRVNK